MLSVLVFETCWIQKLNRGIEDLESSRAEQIKDAVPNLGVRESSCCDLCEKARVNYLSGSGRDSSSSLEERGNASNGKHIFRTPECCP